MKHKRPVNLNLTTVSLPITAVASILHRISGVVIWVGLGIFLYFMGCALSSPENFAHTKQMLSTNCFAQFVVWGLITAFAYYSAATLKHIIQDLGFGEDFKGGQILSWLAIMIGIIVSIWAGVVIWL